MVFKIKHSFQDKKNFLAETPLLLVKDGGAIGKIHEFECRLCGGRFPRNYRNVLHHHQFKCITEGCSNAAHGISPSEGRIQEYLSKTGATFIRAQHEEGFTNIYFHCTCGKESSIWWTHLQQGQKGARCEVCYLTHRRGWNHPNYNSQYTDEYRQITQKRPVEVIQWYRSVREAAGSKCCITGKKGTSKTLSSHHLYSFAAYPNLRFELRNGVCLLKSLHRIFHRSKQNGGFGCKGNTFQQFSEFYEQQTGTSFNRADPLSA